MGIKGKRKFGREKQKGSAVMQLSEILIMVLMLLFFLLLLTSIFSAFAGNEQGAVRLNTELLRSKMAEACSFEKSDIERLSFPQSTPYPTAAHRLLDVPGFLARTYIKITSDPKYVLYYEAFPIGEAVGWEVYHDFDYRIIAPFTYSKSDQTIDFVNFEKELYQGGKNVKGHVDKVLESAGQQGVQSSKQNEQVPVIVNNIILTDQLNPIPNQEPKPFVPGKIPRAGDWKTKTPDQSGNIKAAGGDNTFAFSSYALLTSLEQTALKYRSCGKNSLCLKTQEGVERLALPSACSDVKYVQLEYNNRNVLLGNVKLIGGALIIVGGIKGVAAVTVPAAVIGRVVSFIAKIPLVRGAVAVVTTKYAIEYVFGPLFKNFLAYKMSDFYLASPCITNNVKIEKVDCSQIGCSRWMKYPLYEVIVDNRGERKYVYSGDHYQCVENIEGSENARAQGPQGKCLRVKIEESPEGFCWTADPTKKISSGGVLSGFTNAQTQVIAWLLGFTPVKNSALYIDSPPAIVLKPKWASEKGLTSIDDYLERRYIWSWPGSGEKIGKPSPVE